MAPSHRKALAALLDHYSVPVVEDCCSYDLTASGLPAPMLAGEMSDDLVLTIGTLSVSYTHLTLPTICSV